MPYTTALTTRAARRPLLTVLLSACIAVCLFSVAPEAHAARKKTTQDAQSASASKPKKGSTKVKHYRSPSEESTAERDRRMYRECWGRPNTGACLGYTRR